LFITSQTADISKCDSYIEGLKENCKNLHKCEYYFLQAICADRCAGKYVKVNRKVLEVYMEIQPQITKKRMDEMAALQESLEKQKQPSEETQQSIASSS